MLCRSRRTEFSGAASHGEEGGGVEEARRGGCGAMVLLVGVFEECVSE